MMCAKPFMVMPTPAAITRAKENSIEVLPFPVPCGQCLFCRINKQREMKHRILLEQMAHRESSFITLTYEDGKVPTVYGHQILSKPDFQKFIKRLRTKGLPDFRYFAVGEYGDISGRPHFHAAMFGIGPQYDPIIRATWGMGHTMSGSLTKDSASYIAGYTLKKLTRRGDERLEGRPPEFFLGSKRGGAIGTGGIKKIHKALEDDPRYKTDQALTEIQYGNYKLPLGRYLQKYLAKMMDLEENLKGKGTEVKHEIITEALRKEGIYRENVVGEKRVKRKQIVKKRKIFNKDRSRECNRKGQNSICPTKS
jgi:hypothetical protein